MAPNELRADVVIRRTCKMPTKKPCIRQRMKVNGIHDHLSLWKWWAKVRRLNITDSFTWAQRWVSRSPSLQLSLSPSLSLLSERQLVAEHSAVRSTAFCPSEFMLSFDELPARYCGFQNDTCARNIPIKLSHLARETHKTKHARLRNGQKIRVENRINEMHKFTSNDTNEILLTTSWNRFAATWMDC